MALQFISYTVEGMSCNHCLDTIKKAVGSLNGVSVVNVDLDRKKVSVEFDPGRVSSETIKEVIEDQGYEVK